HTLRDRLTRNTLKRKRRLNWWLIYGPPRTGTSYLTRLITGCSYLYISDWGLSAILNPLPDHRYIRFDSAKFTRDVSNNILDNAHRGGGNQIDLVYKQAGLGLQEYAMLVRMWGRPARIVFCLREPSAYIASARRHFASFPLAELQQCYIRALNTYDSIKGDIFEYDPGLDLADYIEFLHPLELHARAAEPFSPHGAQLPDAVTPEMWSAYSDFKHRHMGSGLMRHHADTT
ncbi:MAG: hypothetical protein H6R26_1285, partial [Proteobacteria bacterium]|nr:hypothetical protein [Pseudomonadota bacterium]